MKNLKHQRPIKTCQALSDAGVNGRREKIKRKLQFINKRREETKIRSDSINHQHRRIACARYMQINIRRLLNCFLFREIKIIIMPLNRLNASWTFIKRNAKRRLRQLVSHFMVLRWAFRTISRGSLSSVYSEISWSENCAIWTIIKRCRVNSTLNWGGLRLSRPRCPC